MSIKSTVLSAECPACGSGLQSEPVEILGPRSLLQCESCDLQSWVPADRPDASWYEAAYQGRDQRLMPLEPGHRFFLTGNYIPKAGLLLDVGCGTGNFLIAAQTAGFQVTGIELDRSAAEFARQHLGGGEVCSYPLEAYIREYPQNKFDVVTCFEVLEHQDRPREFLQGVKACLKAKGWIALSVPNRDRWQKGVEVLDYPPNHLTRWNVRALRNLLSGQGFEVVSIYEEPVGIRRGAQVLSMGLRTGLVARLTGGSRPSFRDLV